MTVEEFPVLRLEVAFDPAPTAGYSTLRLDNPTLGLLDANTLGDAQSWVDVSAFLRSFSVSRLHEPVAGSAVVRYQPGQLACVLNNADRRFDPLNLDGPYVNTI